MTKFTSGNDWYDTLPEDAKKALEGSVIYDGYYSAILGYAKVKAQQVDVEAYVVVYSRSKAIAELAKDFYADTAQERAGTPIVTAEGDDPDPAQEQAYEEAREFFEFNVEGGWLGPTTPLIVADDDIEAGELMDVQRYLPGFVGYAGRCSETPRAVFMLEHFKGRDLLLPMSPDEDDNETRSVPAVALIATPPVPA